MRYTKRERRQIAEAFKAAKPYLWDGMRVAGLMRTSFICIALQKAEPPGREDAIRVVERRLQGCSSVSSWLTRRGVPRDQITSRRVQRHRHAWIDQLIEEFSK